MKRLQGILLFGILFLFLLQLLSDFFESIYAFGLLVTRVTPEAVSVLLIFAPLLLLFARSGWRRPALQILALAALACRVAEPFLPLGERMIFAGLGAAALLIFFPAWLAGRSNVSGGALGPGLSLAFALSIFLGAANSGASDQVSHPLTGLILAVAAGWLVFRADLDPQPAAEVQVKAYFPRLAGLAIGIASVFLALYFGLASPTVIARWTGFSYPAIVSVLAVALVLFHFLMEDPELTRRLTPRVVLVWNALFVLSLVLTILPHQIRFPVNAAAYPFDAPIVSALAGLPLLVMLALAPVVVLDLALFTQAVVSERPTTAQLGGAFGLASLFVLVMVFLHVFTTVYDYIPVVGPLFRDRFWLVYLLAGLGLGLPVLLIRREGFVLGPNAAGRPFLVVLGLVAAGSILAVAVNTPYPPQVESTGTLRIMTYNIQQGFDIDGRESLQAQLDVLAHSAASRTPPDLIGLQESDTARIADGNRDAVRYFANSLGMYSYYGPITTTGTFGIALLSKYPLQNPHTFFMYSSGEQTAAIQAQVTAGGKTYNVFVTHLGNDGPLAQLQDLLARVKGLDPVILMGDFNFEPTTDQYRLATSVLADSWMLRWPDGKHTPGADLPEHIDYIFVSPGTEVTGSEFVPGPASDHPALYTIVAP